MLDPERDVFGRELSVCERKVGEVDLGGCTLSASLASVRSKYYKVYPADIVAFLGETRVVRSRLPGLSARRAEPMYEQDELFRPADAARAGDRRNHRLIADGERCVGDSLAGSGGLPGHQPDSERMRHQTDRGERERGKLEGDAE